MPQATIERELKLGVWPGFQVPDLGKLDGAVPARSEELRLEAVYFDTSDLRLLRRGVTVQFRRVEQARGWWTAKLPDDAPSAELLGREISVPGRAGTAPAALNDLVRGWALGSPLAPVARLRTVRNRRTLRGASGELLAVIDDDEVSIIRQSRVAARFRELELEVAEGTSASFLARLARRMRAAGAQPVEQIPKLVRALGPAALAPWDLAPVQLPKRPSAGQLVSASLVSSAARFVDHIAAAVLDEHPEGIHQVRVGIRRLRSDLRTARPLLDSARLKPLRRELDWLMTEFGEVRDLDVLIARLRQDLEVLDPTDRAGADTVLTQLSQDRGEAYERLRAVLRTPRCAAILEETAGLTKAPPFKGRMAKRPAAEVVPQLVRRPLQELRRQARRDTGSTDADLHRMRIAVKRVRYAAELASPVVGRKARKAAGQLAKVQQVLGDHHDACAAVDRLRELGSRIDGTGVWAGGLLAGLQLAHAAEEQARFGPVWARAKAPKRWRWTAR